MEFRGTQEWVSKETLVSRESRETLVYKASKVTLVYRVLREIQE